MFLAQRLKQMSRCQAAHQRQMETMVTSIPMLILAAIAGSGVLIVISLIDLLSWMKIATPPCARRFICPSLNNSL